MKKLGKEFLLPVAEIEWVQACGNYVNLHRQQHDYPLRTTLAAIEQRLDAAQFVRVHRSYLVNLALVRVIEPTEAGDARLRLQDGSTVPCSRTHLDALRQRLNAARFHPPREAAHEGLRHSQLRHRQACPRLAERTRRGAQLPRLQETRPARRPPAGLAVRRGLGAAC